MKIQKGKNSAEYVSFINKIIYCDFYTCQDNPNTKLCYYTFYKCSNRTICFNQICFVHIHMYNFILLILFKWSMYIDLFFQCKFHKVMFVCFFNLHFVIVLFCYNNYSFDIYILIKFN